MCSGGLGGTADQVSITRIGAILWGRSLTRRNQNYTKADDVAARRWLVPAAERRTQILGRVAPTAATQHASRARCRTSGVSHGTTWILAMPILAPLPDIAMHVIKPPRIWLSAIRCVLDARVSRFLGLRMKPSVLSQHCSIITKAVVRRRPSTATKLPLRFGWQTIHIACCFLRW